MDFYAFDATKILDKTAFIIYCNSQGEIKKFHLVNTSMSGTHFQGISLPDRKFKTFRIDRVLYSCDSIIKLDEVDISQFDNVAPCSVLKNKVAVDKNNPEVCFTGFSKSDKTRLETIAKNNNMTVKNDVTKNLSILCCGYNAGPSKKTKARDNGALAVTENQFLTLIDTGEIPDQGEYDLLSLEQSVIDRKQQDITDTFSTLRTLQRRQNLIANFVDDYAVGWRFAVHKCHRSALDIKLTDMTYNGKTLQVWTQGHAFNFIGGEFIESCPANDQPQLALQIKFTSPSGFDAVDTIDGEFTGSFRKNNAATENGEYKVKNFPIQITSQAYDEGALTVDVYKSEDGRFVLLERIELTQVEFVTLLQFGKVAMVTGSDKEKNLGIYDPFHSRCSS